MYGGGEEELQIVLDGRSSEGKGSHTKELKTFPEGSRENSKLDSVRFAIWKSLWLLWGGPKGGQQSRSQAGEIHSPPGERRWWTCAERGMLSCGVIQEVQVSLSLSCTPGDEPPHWRNLPRATCPHLKAGL